MTLHYYDKIAAERERRKPDPDKQKFVAESKLVILSILCILIIIIPPQDFSDGDEEAELINVFNCRYWQCVVTFARMLGDSLMQPCMHDSEFGEHSRESLKVMHLYWFTIEIKNALYFSVQDFQLDTQTMRRFAVLAV